MSGRGEEARLITNVRLENFKCFQEQSFPLGDLTVLAGPNNAGKSTLLQGLSTFGFVLRRWREAYGSGKARPVRSGLAVTRKGFTPIPLREFDLLWHGRRTAFGADDGEATQPGQPRRIRVELSGNASGRSWTWTASLQHQSREQAYVRIVDAAGQSPTELPDELRDLEIVHVPPFAGIGAEEPRHERGYQDFVIGQGKPGDVLRNLLLDLSQQDGSGWDRLASAVHETFRCDLVRPVHSPVDPFIVVEYEIGEGRRRRRLDIASGGSGFHQVLMLIAFLYARPASVLLLDEPDAHQHAILQRDVFDRVRGVVREQRCQLVVATHSEVLLESAAPSQILAFYGPPRPLAEVFERDRVREALKRVSTLELLDAQAGRNVLYVEDDSDVAILRELARVLGHGALALLEGQASCHRLGGRRPHDARAHFNALRAVRPSVRGMALIDGDDRDRTDHEVRAAGVVVRQWARYEIENYLVHPEALARFAEQCSLADGALELEARGSADRVRAWLRDQLPPAVYAAPCAENAYHRGMAASKELIPRALQAGSLYTPRGDYWLIAAQMLPEEIPDEVGEVLDQVVSSLAPTEAP